ncbi:MAG: hypothetical protein SVT56_08645 [Chloroflexota bacterium]|nr:hypothetical protein [Chloroflexota bacterium]
MSPSQPQPPTPHPAAAPGLSGGSGASAGGHQRLGAGNGFSVERSIASTPSPVAGRGLSEPGWSRMGLRFFDGGGGVGGDTTADREWNGLGEGISVCFL